jgi:hypothetical protein
VVCTAAFGAAFADNAVLGDTNFRGAETPVPEVEGAQPNAAAIIVTTTIHTLANTLLGFSLENGIIVDSSGNLADSSRTDSTASELRRPVFLHATRIFPLTILEWEL